MKRNENLDIALNIQMKKSLFEILDFTRTSLATIIKSRQLLLPLGILLYLSHLFQSIVYIQWFSHLFIVLKKINNIQKAGWLGLMAYQPL